MKYYIDNKGEVFAYESDGSQDNLIGDKNLISDEEFSELKKQKQQNAFDSLSYAEKRRLEYPPIADYVDGVVKGDQEQIDKYIADCLAVKSKYPKPQA
jgi:hypothetical protein